MGSCNRTETVGTTATGEIWVRATQWDSNWFGGLYDGYIFLEYRKEYLTIDRMFIVCSWMVLKKTIMITDTDIYQREG